MIHSSLGRDANGEAVEGTGPTQAGASPSTNSICDGSVADASGLKLVAEFVGLLQVTLLEFVRTSTCVKHMENLHIVFLYYGTSWRWNNV